MLRFTRRSEYGMMALVFLARSRKGCCSVREIHGELGVPRRLLAEVLKALCKVEIVEGIRGPGGGYRLREDPYSISLSIALSPVKVGVFIPAVEKTIIVTRRPRMEFSELEYRGQEHSPSKFPTEEISILQSKHPLHTHAPNPVSREQQEMEPLRPKNGGKILSHDHRTKDFEKSTHLPLPLFQPKS